MNGAGTLIYDGATATSAKPLTLAGNGSDHRSEHRRESNYGRFDRRNRSGIRFKSREPVPWAIRVRAR